MRRGQQPGGRKHGVLDWLSFKGREMNPPELRPEPRRREFCFNDFVLDVQSGFLRRSGTEIPLQPKAFEVLCYLVSWAGPLHVRVCKGHDPQKLVSTLLAVNQSDSASWSRRLDGMACEFALRGWPTRFRKRVP